MLTEVATNPTQSGNKSHLEWERIPPGVDLSFNLPCTRAWC
jgi:hypothetical protein